MTIKIGKVRDAIDSDIPVIQEWLEAQPKDIESLYVNWMTTLKVYRQRGMLVYENAETKQAIAYFWGSLNSMDSVLDVRSDCRGQGVGRAMVNYLMERAVREGEGLLRVACAPASSKYFWRHMGFHISMERPNPVATRVLHVPRLLPRGAEALPVTIQFVSDPRGAQAAHPHIHVPEARIDRQGLIWLDRKVAHFASGRSLEVMITVNETEVYTGPVNTREANRLGFSECANGYAIEQIAYGGLN